MPLKTATEELQRQQDEQNEAWRFSSADLRKMIDVRIWRKKGGGARNDVNHVMLMYILEVSSHATPLLQVNAKCWGQRERGKVVCPRYLQLTTLFLLQNNLVYATVVLLLVLREKSDDITIWISQISCQWSKISFDIACYMFEKYDLVKYSFWYFLIDKY